ncbi:MAG: calcium/sodium antiporter [Thermodesulfobacteriota bacterium]
MNYLLPLAQIGISVVLLWKGADWIVDSAAALARRFRISELVIGLTVVAMGTSLPEFLVTSTAAFKGYSDISLSNIVGSNIFNLSIILGLMALLRPVPTRKIMLRREGAVLLGVVGFVLVAAQDLYLGRPAGIVLVTTLLLFLTLLLTRAQRLPPGFAPGSQREGSAKDGIAIAAGFTAVALGGNWLVEGASTLALGFGVSDWIIGVTIVAAGTSLPELVTCLQASLKGKNDMVMGNLLGSDLFNFAGVLGLTCLLNPLDVSASALPSLRLLVLSFVVVLVCTRTGWRISRSEGALLVCIGLARWGLDIV